jgi:hypothetical protein
MWEVTVHCVENDILEKDIHGFWTELHRKGLIGLIAQAIEKCGVNGSGLFPDQSCERSALGAVAPARSTEAAE